MNKTESKNVKMENILKELISKTPKDKKRCVCKNCGDLGHGISSVSCKINIDKNNLLKEKIKKHILSKSIFEDIENLLVIISVQLDISINLCKTLYKEIPLKELLDRPIKNVSIHLQNIPKITCNECNKTIHCVNSNTQRTWKGNIICDKCWCNHDDERIDLWEKVHNYKPIKCEVCSSIHTHKLERFHYDHLNMFDKDKSICSMVNEGLNIEEIYCEIDKCQIVCLSCHHIITDIESKLSFTRIKQNLTRDLNQGAISEEEYNNQKSMYEKIYRKKMKKIYRKLKLYL